MVTVMMMIVVMTTAANTVSNYSAPGAILTFLHLLFYLILTWSNEACAIIPIYSEN